MGSANITMTDLPVATSPSVVLAHPTEDEKRQTWGMTTSEWAGALTPEQYLEREQYLVTMPVNRDGGITHWILTTSDDDTTEAGSNSDSKRPLLSSCESIMKKILVASPTGDGTVTEEIGHGIGGVYTSTEFRGRSYASRMLAEVGAQLENWDLAPQGAGISNSSSKKKKAICSALWSDIGKKFYAKKGWVPFASQHVEFLAGDFHHETSAAKTKLPSTPITYGNIADFCALDEAALREKLARTARETGKTAMAFSPSHDQMLWHLYRDSYIASLVFPDRDPHLADAEDGKNNNTTNGRGDSPSSSSSPLRQPRSAAALRRHPGELEANEVKGIAVGPVGQRVWAIWTRNFSKGPSSPKDNTLYILRLVVENENQQQHGADDAQLVESFVAVIRAAQTAAQQWSCGRVDLWNPEGAVARLLRDSGLEHEVVEREEASIPSLMWYGEGTKSEDVVWLSNEKYCWC